MALTPPACRICRLSIEEELLCKIQNCGGRVDPSQFFFRIPINGSFSGFIRKEVASHRKNILGKYG